MLSHKNIVSNTYSICQYLQLTEKDVQDLQAAQSAQARLTLRCQRTARLFQEAYAQGATLPYADVAALFLRGFKKGKFMVIGDFMSKLLYRVNGISPRLTDFILDTIVSQGRR